MGLDVRFKRELRAAILGAVVLVVRGAQRQGGNTMFIAGALAMAEHRALVEGIDWPVLLDDVRQTLGTGTAELIDSALALDAGTGGDFDG